MVLGVEEWFEYCRVRIETRGKRDRAILSRGVQPFGFHRPWRALVRQVGSFGVDGSVIAVERANLWVHDHRDGQDGEADRYAEQHQCCTPIGADADDATDRCCERTVRGHCWGGDVGADQTCGNGTYGAQHLTENVAKVEHPAVHRLGNLLLEDGGDDRRDDRHRCQSDRRTDHQQGERRPNCGDHTRDRHHRHTAASGDSHSTKSACGCA